MKRHLGLGFAVVCYTAHDCLSAGGGINNEGWLILIEEEPVLEIYLKVVSEKKVGPDPRV